MYEDIFELITIAAQKKNLKESTTKAYCHALSPFLNATGKPWQELTVLCQRLPRRRQLEGIYHFRC